MTPRQKSCDAVVAAAPVRHDEAVKAPFVHQNFPEQMPVFVGIYAVDPVVGRHDAVGLSLLHGDLKAGEVDFLQRPFVKHTVGVHPQRLLTVHGKVLRTRRNALGLNAADAGGGHFPGKVGIFREVFKVPSTKRTALDIQPRPQQNVNLLRCRLLAQSRADFFGQRGIPGICRCCRRRPAGRGNAGMQPQMIGCPLLLSQAAGTVGEPDGGNPQPVNRLGRKLCTAAEQGAFFLQGHTVYVILYFHIFSPLSVPTRPDSQVGTFFTFSAAASAVNGGPQGGVVIAQSNRSVTVVRPDTFDGGRTLGRHFSQL